MIIDHNISKKTQTSYEIQLKMVQEEGLQLENHSVTTENGYILNMHRLPNPNRTKVMFLMHGLISASSCYIVKPKQQSAGNEHISIQHTYNRDSSII